MCRNGVVVFPFHHLWQKWRDATQSLYVVASLQDCQGRFCVRSQKSQKFPQSRPEHLDVEISMTNLTLSTWLNHAVDVSARMLELQQYVLPTSQVPSRYFQIVSVRMGP